MQKLGRYFPPFRKKIRQWHGQAQSGNGMHNQKQAMTCTSSIMQWHGQAQSGNAIHDQKQAMACPSSIRQWHGEAQGSNGMHHQKQAVACTITIMVLELGIASCLTMARPSSSKVMDNGNVRLDIVKSMMVFELGMASRSTLQSILCTFT
jgi:hypothetical protein